MRLMTRLAKGNPPLRGILVNVPAPASGNTNTVTVNHGLTDLRGNPVLPEIAIPVVLGDTTRQITVTVIGTNTTQVTLRVTTNETTMTPVTLALYVG